ncbi:Ycf48-like protein [compost metagenome]
MFAKRFTLVLACLAILPACEVDPLATTPTGTAASTTPVSTAQAAQAPVIGEVTATTEASGRVLLKVKATDPAGGSLGIAWTVSQGSLTTDRGPSVLWTPPKAAGTYTATVQVVNSKGLLRTAVQTLSVSGTGETTAVSTAQVSGPTFVNAAPGTTGTGSQATGQFQLPNGGQLVIPSPVTQGQGGLIVAPNPAAVTPTPAPPASPFTQPVATPQPGASSAASPIPQPVATPTPTPPPPSPIVLPTPTARPATPAPGVRTPPDSKWTQVSKLNVPTTENLNSLHFIDNGAGTFTTGFAVGSGGTIIRTTNAGASWASSNTGIPAEVVLRRVFFANANFGFVTGNNGKVFRTRNGGAAWEDISPAFEQINANDVYALTVINQAIVVISTDGGKVFRSENADLVSPTSVSWTIIDSRPAARPNDITSGIASSDAFATAADATTTWHAGDGIYRADSDGTPGWSRFLTLGSTLGTGRTTHMSSQNNLWVGTSTGKLYRSLNAAGGTPTFELFDKFRNREFGDGRDFLNVAGIRDVYFVGDNFGWFSTDGGYMYDTLNATSTNAAAPVTWREMRLPGNRVINDFQIQSRAGTDPGGNATIEFFGWGVGNAGDVFLYLP